MAFDYLLRRCLLPGRTSHGEGGKGINVSRDSDETILFFLPDEQNVSAATRSHFEVEHFCDVVVFYQGQFGQAILFVELKGGHIDHAILQLESAIGAVFKKSPLTKGAQRIIAIIVSSGGSPKQLTRKQQEFDRKWGAKLVLKSQPTGRCDLREFLSNRR
jgi:hypothetical protein